MSARVFVERSVLEGFLGSMNAVACKVVEEPGAPPWCTAHRYHVVQLPLGALCPVEAVKRVLVADRAIADLPVDAEEMLAAIEADQRDIARLKQSMEGLEERVAKAVRLADDARARFDRVARAAAGSS